MKANLKFSSEWANYEFLSLSSYERNSSTWEPCNRKENMTLYRLHCWKSHIISQSILVVRCSTVNCYFYISVQSLSKQNSRTSRRDSSDTGDDRTPGEETVGVCNGQRMAVSHRARDPRLTQSCITQCFACSFFLVVLRAGMLLVYVWFLLLCKNKIQLTNFQIEKNVVQTYFAYFLILICVLLSYCGSQICPTIHEFNLWNSSIEPDEISCHGADIKIFQADFIYHSIDQDWSILKLKFRPDLPGDWWTWQVFCAFPQNLQPFATTIT
jgi:hypothetical protein